LRQIIKSFKINSYFISKSQKILQNPYKEALHAMLLPSSNTAAEAVATAVGHRILDYNSR